MNICKRCGKENQEHYKFCLGCGGELTSSAPAGGGGAQKTVMASALSPDLLRGQMPVAGSGPVSSPPPPLAGGMGPRGASPTPPAGIAAVSGPPGFGEATRPGSVPPMGPPPLSPPPLGPPPLSQSPAPGGPAGAAAFGGGATPYGAPVGGGSPFGGPAGGPGPGAAKTMMAQSAVQPGNLPAPAGWGTPPGPGTSPAFTPTAGAGGPAPFASPPGAGFGASPAPQPLYPPPSTPFGGPAPAAGPSDRPISGSHGVVGITRTCSNCGTEVPASFLFCGACGNRLEPMAAGGAMPGIAQHGPSGEMPQVVAPAPEPKPRGRLTLIRPDGSEGGTHDMEEGENQIGRSHGALFENDGYLSPRHAEIVINAAGAVIRDLDSLNGVFVKMDREEELTSGDVFRIGQELLRFDTIAPPQPLEDGTEIMGSPNPGYWGRLSVIIGKDIDGSAFPLFGETMTIGRERGDINFPDDGYVSGVHARITSRDGKCYITDLGSSNGTFIRLRGERMVQDGAFVLFGQQLFRMNITIS